MSFLLLIIIPLEHWDLESVFLVIISDIQFSRKFSQQKYTSFEQIKCIRIP